MEKPTIPLFNLPMYEFLSHLVIGVFLMPLVYRMCIRLSIDEYIFQNTGVEVKSILQTNNFVFWLISYAVGLVFHKLVEYIRLLFGPSTVKAKCHMMLPFLTLFVRNNSKAIKACEYEKDHKNQYYYRVYYTIRESESKILSQLEYQESFLANLCFLALAYLVDYIIYNISHWGFCCNILLVVILFCLLQVAHHAAQIRIFMVVDERYKMLELLKADTNNTKEE